MFFSPGTRIVYDKDMLLQLQHSPMSKSPLKLAQFPGLMKNVSTTDAPKEEAPQKDTADESAQGMYFDKYQPYL